MRTLHVPANIYVAIIFVGDTIYMGNEQINRMNDPAVQADYIDTSGGNDNDITSSLHTGRKISIFGHGNHHWQKNSFSPTRLIIFDVRKTMPITFS